MLIDIYTRVRWYFILSERDLSLNNDFCRIVGSICIKENYLFWGLVAIAALGDN